MVAPTFGRERLTTTDPDIGHDVIRRLYVDHDLTVRGDASGFSFAFDHISFAGGFVTRLQHSMAVTMHAPHGPLVQTFFQNLSGGLGVDIAQQHHRLARGASGSVSPGVGYDLSWDALDASAVGLDPSLLDDAVAAAVPAPHRFAFINGAAISPAADRHWRGLTSLVRRIATANAHNPDGALLADELSRLLVSAALVTFPNTTLTDTSQPTCSAGPASLRRAVAFIEDNLRRPITLTQIADAARVSPRAVGETFRRHLDTSPMAYTRRARLDRAHRDLQAAEPGDGESVTCIAARWGFHSLPRFGVAYRQTYHQPPSHTLRNHPIRGNGPSDPGTH